jgi:hypothetical protein
MEKKIYLVPVIRMKSVESENIMAASDPASVTGFTSNDEVITEGYAASKKDVYDLWDDDNFE